MLPIIEKALQGLKTELEGISEAAGYSNTMARVARFDARVVTPTQPFGISFAERPCAVIDYSGTFKRLQGDTWHSSARIEITAFAAPIPPEDVQLSTDEVVVRLEDDVFLAVAKLFDPQGSLQEVVLEEFDAVPLQHEDETGVLDGVICRLQIHFKHPFANTVIGYA